MQKNIYSPLYNPSTPHELQSRKLFDCPYACFRWKYYPIHPAWYPGGQFKNDKKKQKITKMCQNKRCKQSLFAEFKWFINCRWWWWSWSWCQQLWRWWCWRWYKFIVHLWLSSTLVYINVISNERRPIYYWAINIQVYLGVGVCVCI